MYPARASAEVRWVTMDSWLWNAVAAVTTPHGKSALIQRAVYELLSVEYPSVLADLEWRRAIQEQARALLAERLKADGGVPEA